MEYPHLTGATQYPGTSNIDVYKYRNNFDYTRWTVDTRIKVMSTRLDADYENVGGWESVEERNAYFDKLEGETLTLASALHILPDGSVKLPLPPSVMATYNYLMIELPVATSAAAPVVYESADRVTRFFFFVTDVIQRAENATQCLLRLDEWTTYAPRASFPYMMLERGHYPLAYTNADAYLANPLANNGLLLAPDVSYSTPTVCRSANDAIINTGENWACFATAANPRADWGSYAAESITTPATTSVSLQQGQPSVTVFAVEPTQLGTFLQSLEAYAPQFKRTVQALFLVPKKLVETDGSFDFAGHTCHYLKAQQVSVPFGTLTKSAFGYESKYADLAKLYTSPYAHIELSDGNGTTVIKVEDTTGSLTLETTVSLAWPFLAFDTFVGGVGGTGTRNLNFTNLDTRFLRVGGTWYETLRRWDIPTFAITQGAGDTVDYATYYDRLQAEYAAATANTNVHNSTAAQTANTALSIAAASVNTGTGNTCAIRVTGAGNSTSQALQAWDAGLSRDATDIENATNAATSATNAVGNIAQGFMSGGPAGAAAAVVSGVTSGISTAITITSNLALAEATINNSQAKVTEQNNNNDNVILLQTGANTDITNTNNETASQSTANSVGAANQNSLNNYQVAHKGIERGVSQAALDAPNLFGSFANGATATTRPMGVWASVVTQPDYAIRAAGDTFLRFGYALNQAVQPETLNVMRHFSYWQANDVWISGAGVTAGARATLRAILKAGTTVWKNPDEIGEVSIYGN